MSAQLFDQFGRPLPTAKPKPERGGLYLATIRDRWSTYPGRGITPGKLANILQEADQGYPARQVELFRDAEEKDGHLTAEMGKRRAAVMGLNYEVFPDSDDAKAEKTAEFCREVIFGLEDFDDLINDLVDAVAQGWAMCEIKWDVSSGQAVIADHVKIPQERTLWDDNSIPRLATDASPAKGEEIPPFKVIFHRRKGSPLFAVKAGIMRTCIWWWLFKNFSVKDWMAFADVFGVPLRVGKYDVGASVDDRDALKKALVSLGSDGAALISKSTEIEFIESKISGGSQMIFERLANFCDKANSKAILGQTLTTDVNNSGSRALGEVHNQVRTDLRDADALALAKTLRQQLLRPLVIFNFGSDAPVPWFKFAIDPEKDLKEKGETYDRVMGWGVPITMAHIYETFDIPAPEPGDEVVMGGAGQAELNRLPRMELNSAGQASPAQQAVDDLAEDALEWAEGAADGMAETLHASIRAADSFDGLLGLALHDYKNMNPADLAGPLRLALIAAEINGHLAAGGDQPLPALMSRRRGSRPELNARFIDKPLNPVEAFRFWAGQAPVTRDVFDRLSDDAKLRAFTVAGVFREDMLGELYTAIDAALREGSTLADFKAAAADIFERRGMAGPQPWHLATVFQTNLQSAYMAGRYKQMAGLAAERPYWQYSAVMDAATRPDHAAQHGKVFQVGHPFWSKWYPPNGYNCRCDVLSLSEDEVINRGLRVERSMPSEEPDRGWAQNLGEAGWGRGLVEAAFGGRLTPGAWTFRDELTLGGDAAPAAPAGAAAPGLPAHHEELLRQLGSEEAVRRNYRQAAIEALGLEADANGLLNDLPLAGPMGEGVVLAGRMVDYSTGKAADLARGRFVALAREAVEQADEIWLVPGQKADGRISLRRRYFKFYETGGRSMLVAAEAERGVWQGFNAMPLNERTAGQQRKGLLLYRREQP